MDKNYLQKALLDKLPPPPENKRGWPWTEETDPRIYGNLKYLPKISIVTPSYNQGEFIEQTIRSVLLQNYPNLEYIIIDGGSTDNTTEIIKKYDQWISYWVSEKDDGQSHAINKGTDNCTGEIFNWLNSDDYYFCDCFKNLAESFNQDDVYVVAGNYRFFDDSGESDDKLIDFRLRETLEETLAFVLINQPSTFFRLDKFKSLGKLNQKLSYVMDQDIWKKYLFRYGQDNIKVIDKELSNFRFHSKSKTFQFLFSSEYIGIFYSIAKKADMHRHTELMKKLYDNCNEENYEFSYQFSEEDKILARKVINYYFFLEAKNSFTAGKYDLLKECLKVIEVNYLQKKHKKKIYKLRIKTILIRYNLTFILKLFRRTMNFKSDRKFNTFINLIFKTHTIN